MSRSRVALAVGIGALLGSCSGQREATPHPDVVAGRAGGVSSSGRSSASAGSSGQAAGGVGAGNGGMAGGAVTSELGGDAAGGAPSVEAEAPLLPTTGSAINGTARFSQLGAEVELSITLQGCPMGIHAVHLHQNAACADDGNAAGGHWPRSEGVGDVTCGADGVGQLSFSAPAGMWTIGAPAASNLLAHAVVVHAGFAEEAGARIACGIPAKLE